MENINWYPGHMKKTRELIAENLKLVDLVIEVLDARIPVSSRNPIIAELIGDKQKIIILNKSDLADDAKTKEWVDKLSDENSFVLPMNCNSGDGVKKLLSLLENIRDKKNEGRERKRPLRMMIVGIPNVGKSSLINRLTGKKAAKTGNKPGVTRGKQWLTLGSDMMLLDTPGILWPKFEDPNVGLNLAFCGSIKDEILGKPKDREDAVRMLRAESENIQYVVSGVSIVMDNEDPEKTERKFCATTKVKFHPLDEEQELINEKLKLNNIEKISSDWSQIKFGIDQQKTKNEVKMLFRTSFSGI